MNQPINSHILDANPGQLGWVVGSNWEIAIVPVAGSNTKMMVIYDNGKMKLCRNRQSAQNFANKIQRKYGIR